MKNVFLNNEFVLMGSFVAEIFGILLASFMREL